MYNVTLRGVRVTIVAVEMQLALHTLSVCVCSLTCPACNAREPYCHLWPVRLYNIFPHYITHGKLKKKVTEHNVCFVFSTNTLRILRRNVRDMIINVYSS